MIQDAAQLLIAATGMLSISAVAVQAVNRWLRLDSAGVQRAAWFCVLLQGLMFVRFSLPVPYQATEPVAPNPSQATRLGAPAAETPPAPDPAGLQRPTHEPQVAALAQDAEPSHSAATAQPGWNWWNVMAVTWIAAIALLVSLAAIQYVRLAREVAAAELMEALWRSEWDALLAEHRIRRPIPLRATRDLGPALCLMPSGYQLLVPEAAWQALPAVQRRAVLMHELAHYQRGDVWKSLIARALASVHWFNPCAWWAVRQFETYGELACDQRAAADAGATAYARALLQLDGVQLRPAAFARPVTGGRLFMRVRRILSPKPRQDSIFKRTALVTLALALLVAASLRLEPLAAEPGGGETAGAQGAGAEPAGASQRLVDRYGDRLPEHALLRLGTIRLRHRNFILGTALSPDGSLAASTAGNHDQGISLWETATGRLVRRLTADDMAFGFTRPVAFSPDGTRLLSGDGSGKVRMWDVVTGRQLFSRAWHKEGFDGVTALAFSDGGELFASAGDDGITRVGSTHDGRRIADFADFLAPVAALAFSPDSKRLAVGRAGNPVRGYTGLAPPGLSPGSDQITVWSLDTRQPMANIGTAHAHLMSLFFTSDGEQLITSGNRTIPREEFGKSYPAKNVRVPEIRFWNLTTGKPVRRFFIRDAGYGQAVLSRDGQLLAAGYEGRLRLWDVASGKILRTIEVEQWSGQHGLALSGDGKALAAPVHDSIGLWNAVTGDPLAPEFDSHASSIGAVAWLPGARIATGAEDGTVRLWDAKAGTLKITHRLRAVYCLALSPDGSLLAAGGLTDPKRGIPGVHIWNTGTGDMVSFPDTEDHEYQLLRAYRLAFTPDGTRLAVARDHLQKSNASDIDIWDVRAGQRLLRISTRFEGRVRTMKFSADSSQLYALDERGPDGPVVASWDVATGQEGPRFAALIETQEPEVDKYGHIDRPFVSDAAFTSDLKRLVTSQNRDLVVWDMQTQKPLSVMRTHGTNKGRRLALSRDDRFVALSELLYVGDPGGDTVRVWDLAAEREVLALEPEGYRVWSLAFSPNGRRLVTGTDGSFALIWDLSAAKK